MDTKEALSIMQQISNQVKALSEVENIIKFIAEKESVISGREKWEAELVKSIAEKTAELKALEAKFVERKNDLTQQLSNARIEVAKSIEELKEKAQNEMNLVKNSAGAEIEKVKATISDFQIMANKLDGDIVEKEKLLAILNKSIEGIRAQLS